MALDEYWTDVSLQDLESFYVIISQMYQGLKWIKLKVALSYILSNTLYSGSKVKVHVTQARDGCGTVFNIVTLYERGTLMKTFSALWQVGSHDKGGTRRICHEEEFNIFAYDYMMIIREKFCNLLFNNNFTVTNNNSDTYARYWM